MFAVLKNKVLRQLFREGRYPFAVSIAWTAYSAYATPSGGWTVKNLVATFFPTFFLVVWFFSHWNRVKKQQTVEEGLAEIQLKIQSMLSELDSKTRELAGFITGGDSLCYFSAAPVAPNLLAHLAVVHHGTHPLYGVVARIVDLEIMDQFKDAFTAENLQKAETHHAVGDLAPGHAKMLPGIMSMGAGDVRRFNVFFSARNGSFHQLLRFRRVDGTWHTAIKVEGPHSRFEDVKPGFPRNASGEVEWD
jgi:hypothetical protein